ncbi:MAG: Ig domain-containing protein [Candidatus Woesearchaeota archaeon]
MRKKAQVTIFILLGAIVLIAMLFFTYLRSSAIESEGSQGLRQVLETPADIQPIRAFVDDCLHSTLIDGLSLVSLQAGYFIPDVPATPLQNVLVPFYYDNGNVTIPSKSVIGEQISLFVSSNLPSCTAGFSAFRQLGYDVKEGSITAQTFFSQGSITTTVLYPFTVTKGDVSVGFDSFQTTVDSSLPSLYNYSVEIVKFMTQKPGFVPISRIIDLGKSGNFRVELINMGSGVMIISLLPVDNPNDLFAFASRFDWPSSNQKKLLAPVAAQEAVTSYLYSYQVKTLESGVYFADFTPMFNIDNSTGLIEFVPGLKDKGLHKILIKAFDDKGNFDYAVLSLNIKADNEPPVLLPVLDHVISLGSTFTYTLRANDPNNDTLFFMVFDGPEEAKIANPISGTLTFTPTKSGSYNITVIVVDIKGAVDKQSFTVVVQ